MEKYLIAGLGNIGNEYAGTRHNIGFAVVEYAAILWGGKWEEGRYAYFCETKVKGRPVTLIKPTTYMNVSGKAVQYWKQQLKIENANMMIVTDDLQIELGKLRIRGQGTPGGHNGLTDIIEKLNTLEFPRMRFGIGNNFPKGMQVEYVLGKWFKEEEAIVGDGIKNAVEALQCYIFAGLAQAMNSYNKK
ncbi:MAG: aminoacyl-tRNA hydrolase [Bacteroidota bacterium]|nr:aminoacyl-tRNA hydrolase [Bacteroidota bacterium]